MECRIKINNPNDDPEKWIINRKLEISILDKQGNNSYLTWLEDEKGIYYKFSQLPIGSSILVFDKKSYLKYKFITASVYNKKYHGYLISKVYKCLNNVCLFKDPNCKIKRNKWCSFAAQTIERYENEAKWEEIQINNALDLEISRNLEKYNDKTEKEMFMEGQVSERIFKYFERNTSLRDLYFLKHNKKCQLCGREYKKADGNGSIIDVHHLHFISQGVREVAAENLDKYLVGLCPNCHRWVHSIKSDHELTLDEIKELYNKTHK